MNEKIKFLINVMHLVGIPYLWGGKDPNIGLDCSGFTQKALSFINLNPMGTLNAAELYERFMQSGGSSVQSPQLGDIVFYGTDAHIHHVGIAINDTEFVEAAHGDETVTSVAIANQRGARVKVNPISRMKDLYAIVRLTGYPWEGDPTNQNATDPSNQVVGDPNYTPG